MLLFRWWSPSWTWLWRKRRLVVLLISMGYVFLKSPDIFTKKSVQYQTFGTLLNFILQNSRGQRKFSKVSNKRTKECAITSANIFRVRRPWLPFWDGFLVWGPSWCLVQPCTMTSFRQDAAVVLAALVAIFQGERFPGKKRQPNSQKVGDLVVSFWRQRCFFELKVGYDDSMQEREIEGMFMTWWALFSRINYDFMADFATRRWQKHVSNTSQPVVNW